MFGLLNQSIGNHKAMDLFLLPHLTFETFFNVKLEEPNIKGLYVTYYWFLKFAVSNNDVENQKLCVSLFYASTSILKQT